MKRVLLLLAFCLLGAGGAKAERPEGEVRNLVYMIGDGMGLSHVSMVAIEGGYAPTAFDRAQNVALISTYSANNRVTDSAAAGTALATGSKTGNGMVGRDMEGNPLYSVLARASERGMPTGIAVVSSLQHATPAAFYAHVAKRGDTAAITGDLLASGIDVLLGGGGKWLTRECAEGGSYLDAFRRRGYCVVDELSEADAVRSGRLLGVFAPEHLPGVAERGDYLRRATLKALEVLSNDARARGTGFALMVEGSLIDGAAHGNDAGELLSELRDFESAVAAAMDFADRTPGTLVVVTADHETGGLAIPSGDSDFTRSESGIGYVFGSKSHTAVHVPVFLYGAGADRISGVMDNTQLARRIMELLGVGEKDE